MHDNSAEKVAEHVEPEIDFELEDDEDDDSSWGENAAPTKSEEKVKDSLLDNIPKVAIEE